ncbi:epidermal growth factor-like protein 6 [Onychostoma macrolepis]|uniref:epidermal growth factor-like protein 6 n=1 Tax=Onychostoma macrolepis TaxID=369639 RepID=UPI00272A27EE|nr:epidermal growth factor-like protein 6 [Onychostoma macrolepis]
MQLNWTLLLGLFLPSCSGCSIGFKLVKNTCVDVDECAIFPSVCDYHTPCVNTVGSYYCRCIERVDGGFPCAYINSYPESDYYADFDLIQFKISTDSEAECEGVFYFFWPMC